MISENDELKAEINALRARLSRLSEANLRINEDLDFDHVLREVLESARTLTEARYGVITVLGEAGQVEVFLPTGLTDEESRRVFAMPEGEKFFAYLSRIAAPLRVRDFHTHTRSQGFTAMRSPVQVSAFLAAPIRHRHEGLGYIFLAKDEPGQEFSLTDEETLQMFASQAALVIANARRYRNELHARADLEALINTSPVGVVVFDAATGLPLSINQESRRIFGDLSAPGGSVEQLLDVLTFRRADGREISLDEFPLSQALSSGETVRAEEIVIQVPDGRQIVTLVNATPIYAEEGELKSVVVTVQDLTPLEEQERMRAEFLGMVGHELRTPLAAITGSALTMQADFADLDPSEMRQFLRIIEEQAGLMRALLNDLLDVARIESGTLVVAPEPVDAALLVDRARNSFLNSENENDIQVDIPRELPPVLADSRRIVQVLTNLIANASRHSPESSEIRVTAVHENHHVSLCVADQGKGVPAERLPHLFRKYIQFDTEGRGSGLGLAICKGIVEAHGGRIWAESHGEGLGTRFTFTLPVAAAAATTEKTGAHKPRLAPPQAQKPARILVVDDDPNMLRYVRSTLTGAGYSPVVTADPGEVAALIRTHKPALVLLDLVLPGADGIEIMERTPAMAGLPVIFLSAYGRDRTIAEALQKGAADYLVKPFSPTELVARIEAALRKRSAPGLYEQRQPYSLGGLTIDYARRRVTVQNRPVRLTTTEYNLLHTLAVNAGRVLSHDQLLEHVWNESEAGNSKLLRSFVRQLRRKLGDDARNPTYIFTEPKVGYRMAGGEGTGG